MNKEELNLNRNPEACYAAFSAHDSRFDGRFFVGVSTTGIYCRPVCRVKMPKAENCTYYISAAAAEAAGYRPCLKCRPELAPGLAPLDGMSRIARRAALMLEADCQGEVSLEKLALALGISDRHLRRSFSAEYGVSPIQYLQTYRLLLAKSLLTDTALSITEVAFAAGFGSLRRFNALFKKRYRMAPGSFRKAAQEGAKADDSITLLLGYRPPYDWNGLLAFLRSRQIEGVEHVTGDTYCRTVKIAGNQSFYKGWIAVVNRPQKNALAVTLSSGLLPVLSKVLARLRVLFDLNGDPVEIEETLSAMNTLAPDLCIPGIRLPGCFDPFEMSVRAILGQQVTVKAARTLTNRVTAAFGEKIETPFPSLSSIFPDWKRIYELEGPIEDHLKPLGIIGSRARSIYALAKALQDGQVTLSPNADPEAEMKNLLALPGFGPWTVSYIAMRALSWPDAFPHTDYGIKKALAQLSGKEMGAKETLELAQTWRPWRSYATILLWHSLGNTPP